MNDSKKEKTEISIQKLSQGEIAQVQGGSMLPEGTSGFRRFPGNFVSGDDNWDEPVTQLLPAVQK